MPLPTILEPLAIAKEYINWYKVGRIRQFAEEKEIDLGKFEKLLEKEIIINFYDDFKGIHKYLRSNIFNGTVLTGRIGL